jgi:hypothetical protein
MMPMPENRQRPGVRLTLAGKACCTLVEFRKSRYAQRNGRARPQAADGPRAHGCAARLADPVARVARRASAFCHQGLARVFGRAACSFTYCRGWLGVAAHSLNTLLSCLAHRNASLARKKRNSCDRLAAVGARAKRPTSSWLISCRHRAGLSVTDSAISADVAEDMRRARPLCWVLYAA